MDPTVRVPEFEKRWQTYARPVPQERPWGKKSVALVNPICPSQYCRSSAYIISTTVGQPVVEVVRAADSDTAIKEVQKLSRCVFATKAVKL
jgi:hypothetical protein